jgi:hypothetical protein
MSHFNEFIALQLRYQGGTFNENFIALGYTMVVAFSECKKVEYTTSVGWIARGLCFASGILCHLWLDVALVFKRE